MSLIIILSKPGRPFHSPASPHLSGAFPSAISASAFTAEAFQEKKGGFEERLPSFRLI